MAQNGGKQGVSAFQFLGLQLSGITSPDGMPGNWRPGNWEAETPAFSHFVTQPLRPTRF